jgi:hypothetical protein
MSILVGQEAQNTTATMLRKATMIMATWHEGGWNITATMLRIRGRRCRGGGPSSNTWKRRGLKHHCDHLKEKRLEQRCDHVKEKRLEHHRDHVKQRRKTYFDHEKEWAVFWRIVHRIVLCYRCIYQDWVIRLDRISSSQSSSSYPPCPDQSSQGAPYSVSHVRRSKVI